MTMMATPTTSVQTPELAELPAVFVDSTLAHQIQITWMPGKRETVARCNCGWVGTVRRPEVLGSIQTTIAEYEGHVQVDKDNVLGLW